jgi:hypothetical protein
LAETDFSEELEREADFDAAGFDSDDGVLDSVAGFDAPSPFDDDSLDAVLPFVPGVAGAAVASASVVLGAFFA